MFSDQLIQWFINISNRVMSNNNNEYANQKSINRIDFHRFFFTHGFPKTHHHNTRCIKRFDYFFCFQCHWSIPFFCRFVGFFLLFTGHIAWWYWGHNHHYDYYHFDFFCVCVCVFRFIDYYDFFYWCFLFFHLQIYQSTVNRV